MTTIVSFVFLLDLVCQNYFRSLGYGTLNKGISFGWWQGISQVMTMVIYLLFVSWVVFRVRKGKRQVGLMAMVLGGLGNLLPRLWVGSVWDYLYFPVLGFWFNLSDALISFGVISYILEGKWKLRFFTRTPTPW